MNNNSLNKLEYNKILEILSTFCISFLSKNLAINLKPNNDKQIVETLLLETNEACNILYRTGTPPFVDFKEDLYAYLKNAQSHSVLSIDGILELTKILKLCDDLKNYFYKDYIDTSEYPILSSLFGSLYSNKNIIKQISSCISEDGLIEDNASLTLYSIRKKQRTLEQDIKTNLNNLIHSSNYSKYVQESLVTIRNNRYVIPVKENFKDSIKGFIHDVSSTGSTVFIEPLTVFEKNNELNHLKIEENIEIEKILESLSELFFNCAEDLQSTINIIAKLDFIFAKAKYSKSINACMPIISEQKQINLINAKHPLIDQNKVVPISLNLGNDFSSLIITGPNTGGKTVTLKTVGLLLLMAYSGLNIPVYQGSSIFVFDNIFADIGDNQSIENSLSTFSSHMVNVVNITNNVTNNSLVLLDELGSGTDPLEGANLAISILEYFENIGTLTICTTHYEELKLYALNNKSFQNACVEFDISTLLPTYKLLIGIPGKSNAFEISNKLGLKKNIIDNAKSMMSKNDIDIEELLKEIYYTKSKIEHDKQEMEKKLNNISLLENSLKSEKDNLENKKSKLIDDAKLQARNILLEAKEEIDDIIKKANSSDSLKEKNELRNKLNKHIKDFSKSNDDNSNNSNDNDSIPVDKIKPNTPVFITNLNKEGIILSNLLKSNEVIVQIDSIKMNINIKFLKEVKSKSTNNKNISNANFTSTSIKKTKNAKSEINVIGYNVEDALFVVDKFLDDCYLAKLDNVRIVHGKGTGKLRDGIHKFLKKHPHVLDYRLGTFGEGEMGVTVVKLKF